MNLDIRNGSIEITNVRGKMKDRKLSLDKLPDVILTEHPIELQLVTFCEDGHGHRCSFGHLWQLEFDFHVGTVMPTILSKPHCHDYWEIIIADEGVLEIQIESLSYQIGRGDICILNRATRHA